MLDCWGKGNDGLCTRVLSCKLVGVYMCMNAFASTAGGHDKSATAIPAAKGRNPKRSPTHAHRSDSESVQIWKGESPLFRSAVEAYTMRQQKVNAKLATILER